MRYDIIIVGGGLAGACAALWLSKSHAVVLLEAEKPTSGTSGAAAGLVNPFKGLRATPMWRHEEALDALRTTLEETMVSDLFRATGVFRPALNTKQADSFQKTAADFPNQTTWLSPKASGEHYPDVQAPLGGLWIPSGGAVSLAAFTQAMLNAAERNGAKIRAGVRVTGWDEDGSVRVDTDSGSFEAKTLLLCLGDGFSAFPEFDNLPLHKIKGQTIWLTKPPALPDTLPAISGGVYIVPGGNEVVVGSTFEHEFDNLDPDPAVSATLREKAALLVPSLAESAIVDERAGVRVTVPRVRLPMLGLLPGFERVWIFTALGAKGLMTAPLLARDLDSFLADPEMLPIEVRPPG